MKRFWVVFLFYFPVFYLFLLRLWIGLMIEGEITLLVTSDFW